MNFLCFKCGKKVSTKFSLNRHERNHQNENISKYICECEKFFLRKDNFLRHQISCKKKKQKKNKNQSTEINEQVKSTNELKRKNARKRKELSEKENYLIQFGKKVFIEETAFRKRIVTYRITNDNTEEVEILINFNRIKEIVKKLIIFELTVHSAIKFCINLVCLYKKPNHENNEEEEDIESEREVFLKTIYFILTTENEDEIDELLDIIGDDLHQRGENFQQKGSGWTFGALKWYFLKILKYQPIRGSSFIPCPKDIQTKRCVINIQNNDSYCFLYSILCGIYSIFKKPHSENVNHYKKLLNQLNFDESDMPMRLSNINKFLSKNPSISVNVFGLKQKTKKIHGKKVIFHEIIGPIFVCKERKKFHCNLLMLEQRDGDFHYTYIRDFSRLTSSQFSRHHGKIFVCDLCFSKFPNRKKLTEHFGYGCFNKKVNLPEKGDTIKFKNFDRQLDSLFIIVCDSESILRPSNEMQGSKTKAIQIHDAIAFCYKIIPCSEISKEDCEFIERTRLFTGQTCAFEFIASLRNDVIELYNKFYKDAKEMNLTKVQQESFIAAQECHICGKPFDYSNENKGEWKVRDHDHFNGKYRGASHSKCNILYQIRKRITVYFHNLSYDLSNFIKIIATYEEDQLKVIPLSDENYISLTQIINVGKYESGRKIRFEIRYCDSFRLLGYSLDKLTETLDRKNLVCTEKEWNYDEKAISLLSKKASMCYEYIDSEAKLFENKLPDIEKFYSSLTQSSINEMQYQRALEIFDYFQCKNILEYYILYLRTDVSLLADCLLLFRSVVKENYGLCMEHYYTLPGLSWDAFLKGCDYEIEMMHDVDMISMVSKGVRGGVNQVCHKHVKATNKYVDKNFDYQKETPVSLLYVDANNLYAHALAQKLPLREFEWLTEEEINWLEKSSSQDPNKINLEMVSDESDYGLILDISFEVPYHLHSKFNDLPFFPIHMKTSKKSSQQKLVLSLFNQSSYVVHYKYLKLGLKHGIVLKKINRGMKFFQTNFLKAFIDRNTDLRTKATAEFEKGVYKLFNNSIFGKSIQSFEKKNIILCHKWKSSARSAMKLIARPNFKNLTVFSESFCAIEMDRMTVPLYQPIVIGFSCLELSKMHMYSFWYDYIKIKFSCKGVECLLCYIDTDGLVMAIIGIEDVYDELRNDIDFAYDTSDMDEKLLNLFNFPRRNKKKVGFFKFENNGKIIKEFVGLACKNYCISFLSENEKDNKICKMKGISKSIVKRLNIYDYLNSLRTKEPRHFTMNLIRHKKFLLQTIEVTKLGLSSIDDKRFLLENTKFHSSLALGHVDIKRIEEEKRRETRKDNINEIILN